MNFLGIGTTEILIILAVALIVFGPNRLPELAKYIAQGMKMFRDASNEIQKQLDMQDWDKPKNKWDTKSSTDSYSYDDSHDYSDGQDDPYAPENTGDYEDGFTSESDDESGSPEGGSESEAWSDNESSESESEPDAETSDTSAPAEDDSLNDPAKEEDAQRYSREMRD